MCKDILEDKNIKLEMMNNINLGNVTHVTPTSVTNATITHTHTPHAPLAPQPSSPDNGASVPQLPEKVLEMYNMLIGITTELERIKYELAKSTAKHN